MGRGEREDGQESPPLNGRREGGADRLQQARSPQGLLDQPHPGLEVQQPGQVFRPTRQQDRQKRFTAVHRPHIVVFDAGL